jgi:hypothetical protein
MTGYTIQDELAKWRAPYKVFGGEQLSQVGKNLFDVNTTVKPIDEEDANVEAEKGEVLLQPDGSVFKVLGKSHSKGGTPLNVPNGSFIYSKFKPLSIDKESKELFGFKEGGKYKSAKNTPAELLKREVDIEHHNTLLEVLKSDKHDLLSKKSSQLMLEKNFDKLGKIAYLQEEKKGFPQGLPTFSEGTAPIESEDVEEGEARENQYKMGGRFTPLAQMGMTYNNQIYSPTQSVPSGARQVGFEERDGKRRWYFETDPITGELSYNQEPTRGRSKLSVDNMVNQPNTYKRFHSLMKGAPENIMRDAAGNIIRYGKWPSQYQPSSDPQRFYTESDIESPSSNNTMGSPNGFSAMPYTDAGLTGTAGNNSEGYNWKPVSSPSQNQEPATKSSSGNIEDILSYTPNVKKTFPMLLNEGWAAYNAVNTPNFYPVRNQYNFSPLVAQRRSARPMLNIAGQQASQFIANQRLNNPILARANQAYATKQLLDKSNEIMGEVYNRNVDLRNDTERYNNQMSNTYAARNVDANSQYVDRVNMTNQNAVLEDKMGWNQFASLSNMNQSMVDSMKQRLAAQRTPGTRDVWMNPKTGKISLKPVEGWIQRKQAAPLYDINGRDWTPRFTGAGDWSMATAGDMDSMTPQQLNELISEMNLDARGKALIMNTWFRNRYGMRNSRSDERNVFGF